MEEHLWRTGTGLRTVLQAVCSLVIVLLVSILCAQQIEESTLYRQSAFVSRVVSQKSLGVSSFLSRENIRLLQKFVGAVTDAYISFELIPVNEANTFLVIYESLNEGIAVDRFAYQRKNLTIYGAAQTQEDYEDFRDALEASAHFDSVTGHAYLSTDDTLKFELECASRSAGTYLDLVQQ